MEIPLCPQCLLPRPVLMFHVLAHTSALGEVTGGFQAALDNSFYELCTFHFKDEEAEAQKYKLFGKRGILPWALAIQTT